MKFRPLVKLGSLEGNIFLKNVDYSVTSAPLLSQVREWIKNGSAIAIGGSTQAETLQATPTRKSFFQRLLDRIYYGSR